jgi:hypothetical protein
MLLNNDSWDTAPENISMPGNSFIGIPESRFIAQPQANLASWAANGPDDCVIFTDGINYGSMSGSVFDWPSGGPIANAGATTFTALSSWQSGRTWVDPSPKSWNRDAVLVVNDTAQASDVALPAGSWISTAGTALGSSVHLAPFTSAVLLAPAGASVASTALVTTATGIDYTKPNPFVAGSATGTSTGSGVSSGTSSSGVGTTGGGISSSSSSGSHCGLGAAVSLLLISVTAAQRRRRRR